MPKSQVLFRVLSYIFFPVLSPLLHIILTCSSYTWRFSQAATTWLSFLARRPNAQAVIANCCGVKLETSLLIAAAVSASCASYSCRTTDLVCPSSGLCGKQLAQTKGLCYFVQDKRAMIPNKAGFINLWYTLVSNRQHTTEYYYHFQTKAS